MKGKMFVVALAVSAVVLQTNAVCGAQEEEKGAESVILYSPQGSVVFPHGRHQKMFVDCRPCHQMFPKSPQVIAKMQTEGKLKKKEVMNMCKECHEARLAKGESAGPTACKDCHKK